MQCILIIASFYFISAYVMLKFGDVTNAETIIFKTIKQKCNNSRTHKESIVLDK